MKTIGIFSSLIEPDALTLITDVHRFVQKELANQAQIAFIFSNREHGENPITDSLLDSASNLGISVVTFSSKLFKPELRKEGLRFQREGSQFLIQTWRNYYDFEVQDRVPKTEFDLLLGDMLIWGDVRCNKRKGINLHPALPDGPKGEWYNVIRELIKNKAEESGVMMHKVTTDLDRGPVISYTRFPIVGPNFDELWSGLPESSQALHQRIREVGFERETPLILQTLRTLVEGSVSIEGNAHDLTAEVEETLRGKVEGRQRSVERL